ncbi:alpha/beta hydrolase [Streptomyces finlayi]|uniref:alpha/beta hydrolase n=1 Tax=Streptomyces finlayi TaxID=67296 RepID=UPI001E2FEA6E|nr:alpha/beta hydrolase [Streptomyces finlayi]
MSLPSGPPSFLLVHGSWLRPTCWVPLQQALTERGLRSRTVALPSVGPQRTPTAGMYDDADAITAEIRRTPRPIVVVAHSYAGIPVTQAAVGRSGVAHIVYLAAYVPAEGESLNSMHGQNAHAPGEEEDLTGTTPAIFDDPRASLFGDVPDALARQTVDMLVEQSLRAYQQPVTRAAWRTVPSTYLLCTQDQALPPTRQEQMSVRTSRVERLGTHHCPFLSAPVELAAVLDKIASAGH